MNQLPASKWPESRSHRRRGWAKPLMFPDCAIKMSNVSIYTHRRELGQDVVAPFWQRLLRLWLKTATHWCIPSFNSSLPCAWTALMLYLLICVTDFYLAWMPVVLVNSLGHKAWRPAVYCSQGFFEFSNLKLKFQGNWSDLRAEARTSSRALEIWGASGMIFKNRSQTQRSWNLTLLYDSEESLSSYYSDTFQWWEVSSTVHIYCLRFHWSSLLNTCGSESVRHHCALKCFDPLYWRKSGSSTLAILLC